MHLKKAEYEARCAAGKVLLRKVEDALKQLDVKKIEAFNWSPGEGQIYVWLTDVQLASAESNVRRITSIIEQVYANEGLKSATVDRGLLGSNISRNYAVEPLVGKGEPRRTAFVFAPSLTCREDLRGAVSIKFDLVGNLPRENRGNHY